MDVYGLVAGLNVDEGVAKFAYRQGLYVAAPSNETLQLLNPPEFKPRLW